MAGIFETVVCSLSRSEDKVKKVEGTRRPRYTASPLCAMWLGVTAGDALDRNPYLRNGRGLSDLTKKTVKRAEIHDQWHLRRTVGLRENLPRRARASVDRKTVASLI